MRYCITAVQHKNTDNHCASKFKTWEYNSSASSWRLVGWKSLNEISDLLAEGHEVLSARKNPETITLGAKVEVELRIARNGTQFKISSMPTN